MLTKLSLVAATLVATATNSVFSATVVLETFSDGDRTSLTPGGSTAPKTSIPWFLSSTSNATLTVAPAGNGFASNHLVLDSTAGTSADRVAIGSFDETPVSLNVGEYIQASFDFRNNANFNVADYIGFGLSYSGGTVASEGTSAGSDDDGYSFTLGGLPEAANDDGNIYKQVNSVNPLTGTHLLDLLVDQAGNDASNTAVQSAIFRLTRTGASAVKIDVTVSNANTTSPYVFTVTDNGASVFTFDQFVFGTTRETSAGLPEVLIDNLQIDVVPEPTAVALLSLGLIPALRRRRA